MGGGYGDPSRRSGGPGGLSPHGRGIHRRRAARPGRRGPIPAWAGDTMPRRMPGRSPRRCTGAYPRMGGGYTTNPSHPTLLAGLSPHGRGIRGWFRPAPSTTGPIPAWAGDTSRFRHRARSSRAYPRMGGGYEGTCGGPPSQLGLSPHGRGIRCPARRGRCRRGPIPAWAGDTRSA